MFSADNSFAHPVLGDGQQEKTGSYTQTQSDALLQASRRVDWRFLLPDPNLERVAYLGPANRSLWESLRLFSAALAVIESIPTQDSRNGHLTMKQPSLHGLLSLAVILLMAMSIARFWNNAGRSVWAAGPDKYIYLPLVANVDITQMRPYSAASIWNLPIGPAPQYDPHSAEMIATTSDVLTSDPNQYTFTLYFADNTTPRWDVPCGRNKCDIVAPTGVTSVYTLTNVPIPSNARPSAGSDGQMIIVDKNTGAEYGFWRVVRTGTGWTVSNGAVYNIFWDGMPPRIGARGSGIPYSAGLIRPWEIRRGRIEHALTLAYPTPALDRCVFPATRTDGDSADPYAIPEGARLQLDPALTDADFDAWGLTRTGKIIARALQEYGMFVIDDSGRSKIEAEDLFNNPYATEQWSDPDLNLTTNTVSPIPYTAFRVIALPEAYWTPTPDRPMHGECYAYPNPSSLFDLERGLNRGTD